MPDEQDTPCTPRLAPDDRMRIRFTAADLAAKLEQLQGRLPADTWRNAAAKWIGDAIRAQPAAAETLGRN